MPQANPMANKFMNSREWRSFLATAQSAASYPSMMSAVKASHAWLSGGAANTYRWLLVNGNLIAGARKTLGI
jgi:hypothetical protein